MLPSNMNGGTGNGDTFSIRGFAASISDIELIDLENNWSDGMSEKGLYKKQEGERKDRMRSTH